MRCHTSGHAHRARDGSAGDPVRRIPPRGARQYVCSPEDASTAFVVLATRHRSADAGFGAWIPRRITAGRWNADGEARRTPSNLAMT